MNPSAAGFLLACEQKGLKYQEPKVLSNGKTVVPLPVSGSHGNQYTVRFFFDADGTQVSIRIFGLVTVQPTIYSRMVMRCNTMNNRFPFVKFVVDQDLDLNLEMDCLVTPETAGTVCVEMFSYFLGIAKEAYPEILNSYPLPGESF